jgi:hypothetical protein
MRVELVAKNRSTSKTRPALSRNISPAAHGFDSMHDRLGNHGIEQLLRKRALMLRSRPAQPTIEETSASDERPLSRATVVRIDQGGSDGSSIDGDDSYPRRKPANALEARANIFGPAQTGTYDTPPTTDVIVADPVMSAQLQRAWVESNPDAPDVPSGSPGSAKHEQGGWFLWRLDSHILQSIRVPQGTRDGLGPIVGTRPPDSDIQQVVSWYHTHPNKSSEGYASGPSAGDIAWQNSEAHVPGIIMTHDGVQVIPFP